MTYDDIIAHFVFDSSEGSSDYSTAVLRWINLARSYIADSGPWQSTKRSQIFFTTAAATTTGIYILQDQDSNKYEQMASDSMFDASNELTVRHESLAATWELDQDRSVTGNPTFWADAGLDINGERQVQLWPVPDGAFDIYFIGRAKCVDITDTSVSTDPYLGNLAAWGPTIVEGVKYYHDQSSNEQYTSVKKFDRAIKNRKRNESLTVTSSLRLEPVNLQIGFSNLGKLDPSRYAN